ncbi:hypothetical protein FisN_37Hu013 [Fistulifera solaris]|uniref:Reverse transcriptase zinc-binding domain-containing protein n=1 Tax=Fistulifera solaris TaxID=1519565 RepID=A0A1Z5KJR1_FISSO|nr:hypothetical protein FisN_37Hu013 [Fistulifera solaris]|eukprot:GAX26437.1 hypothetical protein FisN_37Hu013 [Fistulifera solaris]
MIASNSIRTFKSYYQPGGVCQLVGGKWSRNVTVTTADPSGLGQWTYQTISGQSGRHLTIISAYQTCTGNHQSGEKTTWKQRHSILTSINNNQDTPTADPRKHFSSDLTRLCQQLQHQNHGILLFIDANSHLYDQHSWLHPFLSTTSLRDVYAYRHGLNNEPTSYQRGSQRIDFMFASPNLLPFITACGYLPFDAHSDHRLMYCDIHLTTYLRDMDPPDLTDKQPRAILSKHRKSSNEYKATVLARLTTLNYLAIINRIVETVDRTGTLDEADQYILENIDELITATMVNTEKDMTRNHKSPWSPKLIQATHAIAYWNSWIKEAKTGRDYSHQRYSQLKHRQSVRYLKDIQKNAARLREDWLLEQEGIQLQQGHPEHARALRHIRQAEEVSQSFTTIRQAIHGMTSGALKTLLVPSEDSDHPTRITDPTEIIERLIARNLEHFHQAHGTVFTQDNLQLICTYTFETALMELTQLTGNGNEAFDAVVSQLARWSTESDEQAGLLTGYDLMQKFRKWRESTSTSPSGRHLGLYKAILKGENPILTSDTSATPYERIQQSPTQEPDHGALFYDCLAQIINICVKTGYVLKRWRRIHNVMLEKLPGTPLIEKLRVIHIFEADFNAWAGIVFGRRMMQKAELSGLLGNEQGGSRKGKTAIDVYAMKFFTFELAEVTRTPLAVMDNDAKACYDRIVMALAHLRCQQTGIPYTASRLLDNFLNQAEYYIQTNAAMSISHYMQSFVDDSSIWVNDFLASLQQQTSGQSLADTLQLATQWWEELLVTTGGKLELQKCFFYLIEWNFAHSEPRPYTTQDRTYDIQIRQSTNGEHQTMNHKSADEAHRTLGFQAKPHNKFHEQFQVLKQSSQKLTQAIRTHYMNARTAHRAYFAVFLPRMKYPLHLCGLSESQLKQVQSGPLTATLQALGYPTQFPRHVVFGNKDEGGLGFTPLYIEQGIINLQFIMRHVHQGEQLGDTIITYFRWLQHYAGVDYPLLQYPERPTTLLPSKWFTEFRTFLASIQGSMTLATDTLSPLYRLKDLFIMVEAAKYFSESDLRHINNVRLHLQVTRLSDICNVAGTHVITGTPKQPLTSTSFPSTTTRLWPVQPMPPTTSWACWRNFLDMITRDGSQLRTPLGPWIPHLIGWGHKHPHGSFGWSLATHNEVLWEGWGFAHGTPMSSYRAEAYGRLAACRFLLRYTEYMGWTLPTQTRITTATDNKELLSNEQKWSHTVISNPYNQLRPDVDLLDLLVTSWKMYPIPHTSEHVKGHQDSSTPFHELSWLAQLNVQADASATYALDYAPMLSPPRPPTPPSPAHFFIADHLITSQYPRHIKQAAGKGRMREYLQATQSLNLDYDRIDWTSWNNARNMLSVSTQTFITKAICNWLPTNARLARITPGISPLCSRCGCYAETYAHVFQCSHARAWQQQFLASLQDWHHDMDTPPLLQHQLTKSLVAWFDQRPMADAPIQVPVLTVLKGGIPSTWLPIVRDHYSQTESQSYHYTEQQWAKLLSRFLVQQAARVWKQRCSHTNEAHMSLVAFHERQRLQAEITRLYEMQSECIIQHPFEVPLQD